MVWLSGRAACQQAVCVHTRVLLCICTCVPAHLLCALEVWVFFFFPFNVTAKNTPVWVAATTSCQASNLVGFGIISGHKFINTVGIRG